MTNERKNTTKKNINNNKTRIHKKQHERKTKNTARILPSIETVLVAVRTLVSITVIGRTIVAVTTAIEV